MGFSHCPPQEVFNFTIAPKAKITGSNHAYPKDS